ncbi:MAG: hypothetical protein ACRD96_07505, partial [Bryobacteraceae bacterium]
MRDLTREVTVFVTTVGDEVNLRDCLERLERQSARFGLKLIRNVAPLAAAYQKMLDECETRFYVQVDEDMALDAGAVETLYEAIAAEPESTALVCAGLWDCDVERPIYGVKVYRHSTVRRFPYEDTFSCEKTQLARLRAAGYDARMMPIPGREACLGEHGKHYTPRTIFARWRRLMQKQRRYGTLKWVEEWPARLHDRWVATRLPLHLYAWLGATAGLVGELPPDRESDFRLPDPEFERCYAASILIPVLEQREEWLAQAVRSALSQTAPCEAIVVTS